MILKITDLYVRGLLDQGRDGWITIGSDHDRFDYDVYWEEEQEEGLVQDCVNLVARLTELANLLDKPLPPHLPLTQEQQEIWVAYLQPFPDHGLDRDVLRSAWEKEALGLTLYGSQRKVTRAYRRWYEEQALTRLPWKGCSPAGLISRARRYARLVQLKAPQPVRVNEVHRLAEEFLLYHCMVPVS